MADLIALESDCKSIGGVSTNVDTTTNKDNHCVTLGILSSFNCQIKSLYADVYTSDNLLIIKSHIEKKPSTNLTCSITLVYDGNDAKLHGDGTNYATIKATSTSGALITISRNGYDLLFSTNASSWTQNNITINSGKYFYVKASSANSSWNNEYRYFTLHCNASGNYKEGNATGVVSVIIYKLELGLESIAGMSTNQDDNYNNLYTFLRSLTLKNYSTRMTVDGEAAYENLVTKYGLCTLNDEDGNPSSNEEVTEGIYYSFTLSGYFIISLQICTILHNNAQLTLVIPEIQYVRRRSFLTIKVDNPHGQSFSPVNVSTLAQYLLAGFDALTSTNLYTERFYGGTFTLTSGINTTYFNRGVTVGNYSTVCTYNYWLNPTYVLIRQQAQPNVNSLYKADICIYNEDKVLVYTWSRLIRSSQYYEEMFTMYNSYRVIVKIYKTDNTTVDCDDIGSLEYPISSIKGLRVTAPTYRGPNVGYYLQA